MLWFCEFNLILIYGLLFLVNKLKCYVDVFLLKKMIIELFQLKSMLYSLVVYCNFLFDNKHAQRFNHKRQLIVPRARVYF